MFRHVALLICFPFLFFSLPLRAADSDSERLERLERAVQILQQRNAELEKEVAGLKVAKKSSPMAEARATPASDGKSGSDGKTVVERTEVKKPVTVVAAGSELKLALGGLLQTQIEAGDVFAFEGRFQSGGAELKDRFRVRRARINLTGDFAEDFDFKLEGEFAFSDAALTIRDATGRTLGSNSTRTTFSGTDLFANWHRYPEFNVKLGQWKAPFGLEQLTPDPKLLTAERTLVTTSITPERQVGIMFWGRPFTNIWPDQKDLVTYYAGIFNGTGRNISVNDNNEFMYVGRLEILAMNSEILNQEASLKFGANALSTRDDAGNTISSVIREGGDGSLAAFTLPSAGQRDAYGFDASFHIGPFDLVAEYLNERISPRTVAGVAPLFTRFQPNGYYVQGSYYVIPKTLQLVTKWESFDPDQFTDDDIHSLTAGVNYYIKGDDIKLLADYIHTWSDFRGNRLIFEQSEFDEVIVRLQLMF
jgi:phosphate-selective porin